MSFVEVAVHEDPRATVVALSGELDIAGTPRVEGELLAIEQEVPDLLVLDLRGLSFLDSSGLRLVLEADRRAREQGRRFALIRGPDPVHRVFVISLLERRLEFIEDPSKPGPIQSAGPGAA